MACCPPGSHGPKARDESAPLKGSMQKAGEIPIYVTGSLTDNGLAVVVCEDIFGIDSGRTKELADRYATELNCLVVVPELLLEDTWPESYGAPRPCNFPWFIPFLRRNNDIATTKRFQDHVAPFITEKGAKSFAWIGFCLGCCMGAGIASDARFKCGVACHPAFQGFGLAGGNSLDKVMSSMKSPLLVLQTVNDDKKCINLSKQAMEKKANQECLVENYADQVHGFVNRGDMKDEKIARDVEKAISRTVEYIKSKIA